MKTIYLSMAVALMLAVGAGLLLNASYQQTASVRFVGSGADVRGDAGYNLVGKDWSGRPN